MNDDEEGSDHPKKREKPIKGFSLPAAFAQQLFGDDIPPLGPPPPKPPPDEDPLNSELPADSPVQALGYQGRSYFYLSCGGQLVQLLDREHGEREILALFGGDEAFLEKTWPKYGAANGQGARSATTWQPRLAAACLIRECVRQGVWNPLYRMRGPGAWADDQGRLVMHYGDDVHLDGMSYPPGKIGGYIYETGPRWPLPSQELGPGGSYGPGALLLETLKTWNWRRPELDPYLQLGHTCAGKIGGALGWRPALWLVGPAGSGKSTLEERLLGPIYGRDGAIRLIDPTEAAIRQVVHYSSLPVIVDELERNADPRRLQQVVTLARYAASGGVTARGGAAHVAYQFVVRSCFMFSSVYAAPLNAQDRSRIAVLDLRPLGAAAEVPDLDGERLRRIGRLLTRRMTEQWPRFPSVLERFQRALRHAGHSARACDQYGTLATCMFLALHDGEPFETILPDKETEKDAYSEACKALRPDDIAFWEHRFPVAQLIEENDDDPDWEGCLDHLFGALVDPRRTGERRTIGQVIEEDIQKFDKPLNPKDPKPIEIQSKLLDTVGLKVLMKPVIPPAAYGRFEPVLAVANNHRGLLEVFAGSPWAGWAGAAGAGWKQALRRVPGAEPDEAFRFGGVKSRVTKLSLQPRFGWKE